MPDVAFSMAVDQICGKDHRYDPDAYYFVQEALSYTVKALDRPTDGPGKHVSGQELLEGIRNYALQEFGPMALTVFKTWGITKTDDFGEIVFNLVEMHQMGKTDHDKRDDFKDNYDFHEAFVVPFLPASGSGTQPARRRAARRSEGGKRQSGEQKA